MIKRKFNVKWKKIFTVLLLLFIGIQFLPRPEKNISVTEANDTIERIYPIPDSVLIILKTTCYDCHSNNTHYPWYSNIQPILWFLNRHIIEGKAALNLDEFGNYSSRRRQSKLKSIVSQIEKNKMPLKSYLLLHPEAKLNDKQRENMIQWTNKLIE